MQAGLSLRARGHGGRPTGLVGVRLQTRGSTSLPCGTEPPGEGRGSPAAFIAGLSLPARGSTTLPGGTQPLGAGQRGWISRAGGTQPPGSGPRRSPYRPGGTETPNTGLHQPALWDGASWRGLRVSAAFITGLSLPARRSTSLPGRSEPPGAGHGAPPCCTAGLSLRARGPQRWTRWPGATLPPGSGSVVSTRLPCGTHRPGAGHGVRPDGQAGNSLRTLGCGAQSARRY